jgi:hypothetical protein
MARQKLEELLQKLERQALGMLLPNAVMDAATRPAGSVENGSATGPERRAAQHREIRFP